MQNGGSITLNKNVQTGGSAAPQGQLQFTCSFGERELIVQDQNRSSRSGRVWRMGAKGARVLFVITLNVIGVPIPLALDSDF